MLIMEFYEFQHAYCCFNENVNDLVYYFDTKVLGLMVLLGFSRKFMYRVTI